jgi:hypothetical protein
MNRVDEIIRLAQELKELETKTEQVRHQLEELVRSDVKSLPAHQNTSKSHAYYIKKRKSARLSLAHTKRWSAMSPEERKRQLEILRKAREAKCQNGTHAA